MKYFVPSERLEGKRCNRRPREKMMNGMVHWHRRLSVSEIIVIAVCRIEVCGQMTTPWLGLYKEVDLSYTHLNSRWVVLRSDFTSNTNDPSINH